MQVKSEQGHDLVELVYFGRYYHEPLIRSGPYTGGCRLDVQGVLIYSPCIRFQQYARWVEQTDYRRNPICNVPNSLGFHRELRSLFEKREGIRLDLSDWPTSLVQIAIPYATTTVNVVAPDGFTLPRSVWEEAHRHGVELHVAPLSYFPRELVRKMTKKFYAPAPPQEQDRADEYHDAMERFFGESVTAYRHLVPDRWREGGIEGKDIDW